MTDRWSDPDLVWALFQAALSVPLAAALLVMLAVLACLGLFCAGYALQAGVRWLWARRWWRACKVTERVDPDSIQAQTINLLREDLVAQFGIPSHLVAGGRRRRRSTPPLPPVPQMWSAESLRAMTHDLLLYEAMSDAISARPWLADPRWEKRSTSSRLSNLSRDSKPLKYETEDGQRTEIGIDGKPHRLPTATRSYIVTDNGLEPVQNATAAAAGGQA